MEEAVPYDGSSELLYHGTNVWFMSELIAADTLLEGAYWGKPGEPHGPRLSESDQVAETFIEYASPDWPLGGVLVLDTWGLMQDYKLVTYQDKPYGSDIPFGEEREVVPLTEAVKPLSKYLRAIKMDPEVIQEAASTEGLEFAKDMWDKDPRKMTGLLASLAKHPLLRK